MLTRTEPKRPAPIVESRIPGKVEYKDADGKINSMMASINVGADKLYLIFSPHSILGNGLRPGASVTIKVPDIHVPAKVSKGSSEVDLSTAAIGGKRRAQAGAGTVDLKLKGEVIRASHDPARLEVTVRMDRPKGSAAALLLAHARQVEARYYASQYEE